MNTLSKGWLRKLGETTFLFQVQIQSATVHYLSCSLIRSLHLLQSTFIFEFWPNLHISYASPQAIRWTLLAYDMQPCRSRYCILTVFPWSFLFSSYSNVFTGSVLQRSEPSVTAQSSCLTSPHPTASSSIPWNTFLVHSGSWSIHFEFFLLIHQHSPCLNSAVRHGLDSHYPQRPSYPFCPDTYRSS